MIKCIAVDDEPLALELLEDNISKVPFLQLAAKCENVKEAMQVLQEQPIDLIFLDIQMPGLTGIQFIKSMTQKPMIIFVTAYEKHALDAFNLDVIDYLVKPVALDRFVKACNKAKELYQLRSADKDTTPDYFFFNVDYTLQKVIFNDIMWIEGLKDYIKIHLKSSSKPVVTRMSMKMMEELLPSARFIRVHKSFIISLAFVTAVRKKSVFIGPTEITISDSYPEAMATIIGKATQL